MPEQHEGTEHIHAWREQEWNPELDYVREDLREDLPIGQLHALCACSCGAELVEVSGRERQSGLMRVRTAQREADWEVFRRISDGQIGDVIEPRPPRTAEAQSGTVEGLAETIEGMIASGSPPAPEPQGDAAGHYGWKVGMATWVERGRESKSVIQAELTPLRGVAPPLFGNVLIDASRAISLDLDEGTERAIGIERMAMILAILTREKYPSAPHFRALSEALRKLILEPSLDYAIEFSSADQEGALEIEREAAREIDRGIAGDIDLERLWWILTERHNDLTLMGLTRALLEAGWEPQATESEDRLMDAEAEVNRLQRDLAAEQAHMKRIRAASVVNLIVKEGLQEIVEPLVDHARKTPDGAPFSPEAVKALDRWGSLMEQADPTKEDPDA